jgi:peptide/nickel transport system substrate-binding protein
MNVMSRRKFVRVGGGALAGTYLVSGCSLFSTEPGGGPRNTGSGKAKGREAPALAAQVKKGALPPVAERLPDEPLVLEPVDGIGQYGGTWHTALLGPEDEAWLLRTLLAQDRLVGWDLDWEKIVPSVARDYQTNDDGTEYTITLRRGMKWSDGKPFTADDIMFWYEDVFANRDLTPVPAEYLTARGEPVVVKKVDDQTVTFTFAAPSGLFLQWLATYDTAFELLPRHYLEQFHPKYNPDIDSVVSSEGAEDWVDLFATKANLWANPELPRVHAWVPLNALGEGNRIVCERNPYYFKVDPDQSQLPYLDRVVFEVVTDEETLVLKASNGDFDMHARHVNTPKNKPVLARGREKGDYSFIELKNSYLNTITIHLNLTHKDPVKRQIFQNKNFRIGLSHAINRQEVIDIVYQRQGEPWQVAPRPEAPFADQEMGTQYTEYDPKLANEFLDRAGFSQRGPDGIRLGPDGKPISFAILAQTRYFEMFDALELMRKYWLDVGIDMQPQNVDGTLWNERVDANEHDGALDDGSPGYKDAILDPRWFFCGSTGGARYAPLWNNWYIGAGEREEPPEPMKRQMDIYRNELLTAVSTEAQIDAMRRIVQIAKEEFWIMGMSLPPNGYAIVKNTMHNVPKVMWEAARYPTPGPSNPSQYYLTG